MSATLRIGAVVVLFCVFSALLVVLAERLLSTDISASSCYQLSCTIRVLSELSASSSGRFCFGTSARKPSPGRIYSPCHSS